jgi:hypothetical protein
MTTTVAAFTLKDALDAANPSQIASALRKIKLGTMLTPIQETITLGTVRNHIHLLTDSVAKKAALQILSCRVSDVTGGAGAVGARVVADATPAAPGASGPGIVTLSADGDIITFEGTILAAVVWWLPMPDHALTVDYAPTT